MISVLVALLAQSLRDQIEVGDQAHQVEAMDQADLLEAVCKKCGDVCNKPEGMRRVHEEEEAATSRSAIHGGERWRRRRSLAVELGRHTANPLSVELAEVKTVGEYYCQADLTCGSNPVPQCKPIDGGLSEWNACSVSCDGGVKTRTCDNPAPENGGKDCEGDLTQTCGIDACPVNIEDITNILYVVKDMNTNGCDIYLNPTHCETFANEKYKVDSYTEGFRGTLTNSHWPKGCYQIWNEVYFNTHSTGRPEAGARPVCAEEKCLDDPDWTDWKYGRGSAGCVEIAQNPSLCTDHDHAKYSEVASIACPVTCGTCTGLTDTKSKH